MMRSTKNTISATAKTSETDSRTQNSEFDGFAENYDNILSRGIKFSGYDSAFFDERKIREIYQFLKPQGITEGPLKFLNFGCGIGKSEKFIARYFPQASIYSVDTSQESIEIARMNNRNRNNVTFSAFDGYLVPFEIEFDVVLVANVFHHIPSTEHMAVLKNIFQKTAKHGYLFIFEHNPFNPLTRKVVNSCPLDNNAVLLAPFYTSKILRKSGFLWRTARFIHFFPKFLSFLMPLEKLLRKVPLGAQYYFVASKHKLNS